MVKYSKNMLWKVSVIIMFTFLFQNCATAPKGKYVGDRNDNGKYHGNGTLTYPTGEQYTGSWINGRRNNGYGVLYHRLGEKYSGNFKNGLRNGNGKYTYTDGATYEGDWIDGKRNGVGRFIYADGGKYIGEFKDDLPNGKGVLFLTGGSIQSGIWTNGNLNDELSEEAVNNTLKNKYNHFKGLYYQHPTASVSLSNIKVYQQPPDDPIFIAVVDFRGNNISDGNCKALTDRLRTELFNTKCYKVVEREMMENVLIEQGFQQSGCTTNECMVEIGQLIGVEKIIGGSISKVGNIYSISSRVVNVETGEIENTGVYDYEGDIGNLLTKGMKTVAVELAY